MSGGRHDDATMAIGHRDGELVIVDNLLRWKPPFSPQSVIEEMANTLREYKVQRVQGDNYSADFVVESFARAGISYFKSKKAKSELYADLLSRLCSRQVELIDNDVLITQLSSLERRPKSGGRDVIDHPANGRDDVANAVAGLVSALFERVINVGVF
jgi:hypothetical protein